jgi:hypothetical protein
MERQELCGLDRLLSDDYKAATFRGLVSTKANEIATAKEDHDYSAMDGKVMSVMIFGDSAVVFGLIDARWKMKLGVLKPAGASVAASL